MGPSKWCIWTKNNKRNNKQKTEYKPKDKVSFKITITNNETYRIKDIIINEKNENSTYVKNEKYQLLTDQMVWIEELGSKESIEIYAEYIVNQTDKNTITLETELIGALEDNNYYLNKNKEYKVVSNIKIEETNKGIIEEIKNNPEALDNIFKYIITLAIGIIALITYLYTYKKVKKN